jgi:hypothetical protein
MESLRYLALNLLLESCSGVDLLEPDEQSS